jgi:F0F1-type ATP synthase membrane subunit b/b'
MTRPLREHAYFVLPLFIGMGAGLIVHTLDTSKEWVLRVVFVVGIICFYFLVSQITHKILDWRFAPIMKELDAAIEEQQRLNQLVREDKISSEEYRKRYALNVRRATEAADKL